MSALITAADLADFRATQAANMPFTCVVTNYAADVDDGAGGTTPGATTTVSVACRVGVPSANDQKVAERLGQIVDALLTLPYGTAVTDRSTIAVSDTGRSYDVVYVNTEQSNQTAVRAVCRTARS